MVKCCCPKKKPKPGVVKDSGGTQLDEDGVQLEITDSPERHVGFEDETNGTKSPGKASSLRGCPIDQGGAREILELMNPTPEQVEFFETWMETIAHQAPGVKSRLSFHTDGSNFEYTIIGKCKDLSPLVDEMVTKCEMPTDHMEKMEETIHELKCQEMSLWCKLKNIPSEYRYMERDRGLPPAVDLGYSLHCPLSWTVCDLLMPPVQEHDLIRDYTQSEKQDPIGFGSSLLPIETETRLLFRHDTTDASSTTKMSVLFFLNFFKSLGFPKPEDSVIDVLFNCNPTEYGVIVHMGPKGLTRLTGSLENPSAVMHKNLCTALDYPCAEKLIAYSEKYFGGHPSAVEYIADSGGYCCALVYST